jgi:hypothetical protein
MYLTRVTVDATTRVHYAVPDLHCELTKATTEADGVQHVHIEVDDRAIVFTLYIQAGDRVDAGVRAEQLCRRTMAAVCEDHAWQIRSTQYGP